VLLLLLLQAQGVGGRPVKYSGMADVFRQTYANEGLRGFYKVGGGCQPGNAHACTLGRRA
jgi:hypothetical protein